MVGQVYPTELHLNKANLFDAKAPVDETSIVDMQRCHMAGKFGVFVDEDHRRLLTL